VLVRPARLVDFARANLGRFLRPALSVTCTRPARSSRISLPAVPPSTPFTAKSIRWLRPSETYLDFDAALRADVDGGQHVSVERRLDPRDAGALVRQRDRVVDGPVVRVRHRLAEKRQRRFDAARLLRERLEWHGLSRRRVRRLLLSVQAQDETGDNHGGGEADTVAHRDTLEYSPRGTHMNLRTMAAAGLALLAFSPTFALSQGTAYPKPAGQPAGQQPAKPAPKPAAKPPAAKPAAPRAALRTPSKLKEQAPPVYNVAFDTSAGSFVVQVTRAWAPNGADRFYNLVKHGYYDGARFFRVIPNFMVQFGINGDPKIQSAWREATIRDEPVVQSNKRGFITFAKSGMPNSRTTQVFINHTDNSRLDADGFSPFGQVISGMEVVDKINAEYRQQPEQDLIQTQGNAYLTKAFPRLDFIKSATIGKPASPPSSPPVKK
jgi:peptidyl-prolyl cis-trans isomerase A (cyclophilin A)